MSKRDKGEGIQKADDYKMIPTKNTFFPLLNSPSLTYKYAVIQPSKLV